MRPGRMRFIHGVVAAVLLTAATTATAAAAPAASAPGNAKETPSSSSSSSSSSSTSTSASASDSSPPSPSVSASLADGAMQFFGPDDLTKVQGPTMNDPEQSRGLIWRPEYSYPLVRQPWSVGGHMARHEPYVPGLPANAMGANFNAYHPPWVRTPIFQGHADLVYPVDFPRMLIAYRYHLAHPFEAVPGLPRGTPSVPLYAPYLHPIDSAPPSVWQSPFPGVPGW